MMLSERKLVALCVACSVLGVVALFIIAFVAEPLQVSPSGAAELGMSGARSGNKLMVKVAGFVDSVSITESRAVVKIAELETVEAVSFDIGYIKGLGLKRFQEVEVFGELRQYKGKDSLIISRLRLVNGSSISNGISNISCAVG